MRVIRDVNIAMSVHVNRFSLSSHLSTFCVDDTYLCIVCATDSSVHDG